MSSPGLSGGSNKPAEIFKELWTQLGQCHQNALEELEEKVSKLKKERCSDAQRLEVFYSRNRQLKEQNKTLQEAVGLLEERLRAGECDRCAILEEEVKTNQEQNLRLIAKLKNERNSLEEENIKIQAELQKLTMSCSDPQQSSEQEEGIIPDSPVLPSSLPAVNRLKKCKNMEKIRRVRYAEQPLARCNNSLFRETNKEPVDASNHPRRAEVLVPNTCDLDFSQMSNENNEREDMVAETCALEPFDKHPMKPGLTSEQHQSRSNTSWKNDVHSKPCCSSSLSTWIHSPDSTTVRSPSLLTTVKRFSQDGSIHKAKRKKEESEQEDHRHRTKETVNAQREGKHVRPEPIIHASTPLSNQSFVKQPVDSKVMSSQNGPYASCASPVFKKPDSKGKDDSVGRKRNPLQDVSMSHDRHEAENAERTPKVEPKVEPTWSIDPALAMSMYDSEWRGEEQTEIQHQGEMVDTDCTWVSHSMLQARGDNGQDREDSVCGLGEKANDSLDMMFDTMGYGEYKSYNCSHSGQSQTRAAAVGEDEEDEEEEVEEDDNEEENDNSEQESPGNTPGQRRARHPTFAHVAVVRKKDERRKLKGTTCKECEIYYAHLPEEEKQQKLSSCSRHRFLYIPPSTPENFWEVGFPSTQTCIERGYIREEKNPQARLRRRQPLHALFSPKQESQL